MTAARILDEKQAREIRVFDVSGISTVTDYYLVATGTSSPHLKALVSQLQHQLKALGVSCYRHSGTPESGWVVVDYVDVVIHIFAQEARDYYAIESLWKDARPVPFEAE